MANLPSLKEMAEILHKEIESGKLVASVKEQGIIKSVLAAQKKKEPIFPAQMDALFRMFDKV